MGRATDLNAFAGKLRHISSVHFVSSATLTGQVGDYMHEGRVVTKRLLIPIETTAHWRQPVGNGIVYQDNASKGEARSKSKIVIANKDSNKINMTII